MATELPLVYSHPDTDALSTSLGEFIIKLQDAALEKPGHSKFRVAMSGGSLPDLLVQNPEALLVNPATKWSLWEIFFADEREVPLEHEDSNYGLLKRTLLDKIPSDHPHGTPTVYPIEASLLVDGERGVTQEIADAYEQDLIKTFAAKNTVKLPIFDLMLLGCGPDGHTCSLFPGHELLREGCSWVAAIEDSPKPPPKRITLTLPVVTHASHVVFVVTGEAKRKILKTVFEQPEEDLPCSLVNVQAGGNKVTWFVDDKAVEGLVGFNRSRV